MKSYDLTSFAALLAMPFALFGVTFPNADKSYDIYSAAAWGDTAYPDTTTTIMITEKNATYTFSEDMTFGMLYFNGANMKIDLTSTPERKITLTSASSCIYPYSDSKSIELAGGYYYASNRGQFVCITTTYDKNPNTSITLSSGVIVTNAGVVKVKNGPIWGTGPALIMKSGAKLYATGYTSTYFPGEVAYTFTGDPTETGVSADISGGAQLFKTVESGEFRTGSGVMLVRGEGTLVNVLAGSARIGSESNSVLHVTDNAQFLVAGTIRLSDSVSASNGRLYIDNGGHVECATAYIGGWGKSYGMDHHLIAGPGGSFRATNIVYLNGTNESVVVSNGTLRLNKLSLGNFTTDRGNMLKLYGPSASLVFDTTSSFASFLASGSGHRFVMDGGATYSTSQPLYISSGRSNVSGTYTSNTVEIVNGSKLTMTESLWMRNYAAEIIAANGNTVRVASGGELECRSFQLCSADNTLVISNGTVTCVNATAFKAGDTQSNKDDTIVVPATNGCVILEGETPLLRGTDSAGKAYFRQMELRFHPSPSGFTTSAALVSFPLYDSNDTASLAFEGLEEVRKNLEKTATYTLLEATHANGTVSFTDAQIAAATGLSAGCTLYKSADNKRLLLRIRPDKGAVLVVR